MGLSDTLYFNSRKYAIKLEGLVACERISEVREREVLKNRQIYGYSTKIGMGAILFVPTGGLSTITSVVGFRQLWVTCAKLKVINSIIEKYNITPYECGFRDLVVPIVTNVLTAGIGCGVSYLLGDIASIGVEGASTQGVSFIPLPGAEDVVSSAMANPDSFAGGFAHGVEAQVHTVSAALDPGDTAANITQATIDSTVPMSVGDAYVEGGNIGYSTAAFTERFLVQQTVASSLQHIADQSACNRLHRRIAKEAQDTHKRPSEEMRGWHQELEEVYDALLVQYADLITAHSELLNKGENKRQGILVQSKQMPDKIVTLSDVTRDCHFQAEEYNGTRFINAWDSCLKKWEEAMMEQASTQAEWKMIMNN
jgi:hypothetical protein